MKKKKTKKTLRDFELQKTCTNVIIREYRLVCIMCDVVILIEHCMKWTLFSGLKGSKYYKNIEKALNFRQTVYLHNSI
jgi:hypothetical protein